MNIREKYTGMQVEKYYKKFENGKITIFEFLQCASHCISETEKFRFINKVFINNGDKVNDETFAFLVNKIIYDIFAYTSGRRSRYVDSQKTYFKDRLENIFTMKNISTELKEKFVMFLIENSTGYLERIFKINFEEKIVDPYKIIDGVLQSFIDRNKSGYSTSEKMGVIMNICNVYRGENMGIELRKYAYENIKRVIDFDVYGYDDVKNKVNVFFNEFIDSREEIYATVKQVMKKSLGASIKELINKDLPFGMCVNAFVEVLTEDIIKMEPEMIEQLNASIIAYKMLKKSV